MNYLIGRAMPVAGARVHAERFTVIFAAEMGRSSSPAILGSADLLSSDVDMVADPTGGLLAHNDAALSPPHAQSYYSNTFRFCFNASRTGTKVPGVSPLTIMTRLALD
jgi:hypothetical protein